MHHGNKKQDVVSRSSTACEITCEITWLSALLNDIGLKNLRAIAANPVLHE